MKEQKLSALILMILSLLLYVMGGIFQDMFLVGSGAMLLAMSAFDYLDFQVSNLKEEIRESQQAHYEIYHKGKEDRKQ